MFDSCKLSHIRRHQTQSGASVDKNQALIASMNDFTF